MAGGDTQSILRALEKIQASLTYHTFQMGYIRHQNDMILRGRSTAPTDTRADTSWFGKAKELYETGEFLSSIGRVAGRLIMPLLSPYIIAMLSGIGAMMIGAWKAVSRGWLGF